MRSLLLSLVCLAACGDDHATVAVDAAPLADSAEAADAPPSRCDYTETRDLTNDDVSPATGTPEQTALTFAGHAVVCGTFDSTHFDGDITVDIDGYLVALAADADVLVRIHGAGAEAIELVGLDIYTGPNLDQRVGGNTFYGDHGVTSVHLVAGTYELAAFALNGAAITGSVAYEIQIVTDTPATRCPALTTGGYAEAHDGPTNDGNDMIRIPSGSPPSLTTSATDVPEPTGLVTAPGTNTRLSGSVADIVVADQYEDKDTYAFATGASTNELAVRLVWPTATANLDYLVYEADTTEAIARATVVGPGPELVLFSVKPNTSYWLLVGAKVGSTGLPAAYDATVCPAQFTP